MTTLLALVIVLLGTGFVPIYGGKSMGCACSTQTPQQRRDEADRILNLLEGYEDGMVDVERNFVTDIQDGPVSPRQLWWLRDLKEKYL